MVDATEGRGRTAQLVLRTASDRDLAAADGILRAAFDAHTGRPGTLGDTEYLRNRSRSDAGRVVVAVARGEVVGSNAITAWGSVGWFGPLSVTPAMQRQGIADALVEAAHERLHQRGATQLGLFTFADSPRHFKLYARHGYWPGSLVLITSRQVPAEAQVAPTTFTALPRARQHDVLYDLRGITEQLHPGWDITSEVVATTHQGQGDVVLVHDDSGLSAAAVCQIGPGTEAGAGTCRLKIAVVRSGRGVDTRMTQVLAAVDALARERGAEQVIAAVSTANEACARFVLARGHDAVSQGVAMHRGGPAYRRTDVWVLDDWR